MPRAKRIRITLGLMALMLGVVTYYLGPVVTPVIVSQTDAGENDYGGRLATRASLVVALSGMALAALAFLYVFLAWASWFIGLRNSSKGAADGS
jgi:hypothetical protein